MPPFAPIAAAALAVLALVSLMNRTPAAPAFVQTAQGEVPVVYVQFALTAQGAHTVSVAGDFNDWSVDAGTLRAPFHSPQEAAMKTIDLSPLSACVRS